MAKQIYIDENGNEQMISGTINNASLLPISANDSTNTKSYIDSVVESGTNSNGYYIKYKDGTMICAKVIKLTFAVSNWTAWGSCYETVVKDCGNWAVSFYSTPFLNVTLTGNAGWLEYMYDNTTSNVGKTRIVRPSLPGSETNYWLNCTGIGRWKA